jgi:hypothetical protein
MDMAPLIEWINPIMIGSFAECAGEEIPRNIKKITARAGKRIVFFIRVLLSLFLNKSI